MSEAEGTVKLERDGKKLIIEIDRKDKMNGFTPMMFDGISKAFQELEDDPDLWVGLLFFAGEHTTAGLDLLKFLVLMRMWMKKVIRTQMIGQMHSH